MKRNLLALIAVVLLITVVRGTFQTPGPRLEIYRQAGEGSVELMGVVTEESAVRAYHVLYDQLAFTLETVFTDYPDVAVYLSDDTGTVHHTSVWFEENGEGSIQQMTGNRKVASLSVKDTKLLKEILQQKQPASPD